MEPNSHIVICKTFKRKGKRNSVGGTQAAIQALWRNSRLPCLKGGKKERQQRTVESENSKRGLHKYVHISTAYNTQKVPIPLDRWMTGHNMVRARDGLLSSLKREGAPGTCYNMDEPWGLYTQRTSWSWNSKSCVTPVLWGSQSSRVHRGRKKRDKKTEGGQLGSGRGWARLQGGKRR